MTQRTNSGVALDASGCNSGFKFLCLISLRDDLYRFDFGDNVVYATFAEAVRILRELKKLQPRKPLESSECNPASL